MDERVQAKLGQLGVEVLRQCRFDSWVMEDEYVHSLNLMMPLHALTLKCFALFYFGLQAINMHAFKGILYIFILVSFQNTLVFKYFCNVVFFIYFVISF